MKRSNPTPAFPRDLHSLVVGVVGAKDVRSLVDRTLKDAMGVLNRRNLALGHVGYAADVVTALDTIWRWSFLRMPPQRKSPTSRGFAIDSAKH